MTENELITGKGERIVSFFKSLDRMLDGIEGLVRNCKPTLGGERYLTDKEVSARLKLSRRTLQDYRNEGRIPYYQLGGKILYRESDIEKVLNDGYKPIFQETRVGSDPRLHSSRVGSQPCRVRGS